MHVINHFVASLLLSFNGTRAKDQTRYQTSHPCHSNRTVSQPPTSQEMSDNHTIASATTQREKEGHSRTSSPSRDAQGTSSSNESTSWSEDQTSSGERRIVFVSPVSTSFLTTCIPQRSESHMAESCEPLSTSIILTTWKPSTVRSTTMITTTLPEVPISRSTVTSTRYASMTGE